MDVYNGTGYFIDSNDLTQLKISDVRTIFPTIDALLVEPIDSNLKKIILERDSMFMLLSTNKLITDEPIIQYDQSVCFAGEFQKFFDESDLSVDSGDLDMVENLIQSDGYDYAVSNEDELDHRIEMLTAILKKFNLLSDHSVLETYWFLMPYLSDHE